MLRRHRFLAYLRAFRTVLFAFSLSANWSSHFVSCTCIPLSFVLSFSLPLSLSLFLSFASTFLALLLLLVPHLGCCLLCAYLTVAIRPHFLHFIILFLRIKGEKKRRHAKLSVETFAGRITGQLLKFSTSEISDICLIYYTIKARISLNDKFFAFRDTNNVRDEREDWYSRICPMSYF